MFHAIAPDYAAFLAKPLPKPALPCPRYSVIETAGGFLILKDGTHHWAEGDITYVTRRQAELAAAALEQGL